MPITTSIPEPLENADRSEALSSPKMSEINLLDYLILIADYKQIILRITACFGLLGWAAAFILPARYTANVVILPLQQNSSTSSSLAAQMGNLGGIAALASGGLSFKNPNDMNVALLKSRTIEDAMVQHYGLMQEYKKRFPTDARSAFEDHVRIDGSGKDGLIHIFIWDHDPKRAAALANGYIDQFQKLSGHLAITEASQRRLFFEQQLEQAKDSLATAEEAMKKTEQNTGMFQLDSQARLLIETAANLRAQIASKEVQISSLQTFATSQNSQLIQAQQELSSLRAQLEKLGGSELDSEGNLMVPKGRLPEAGLEYVRKLRDVKYREAVFGILARQYEAAKLDEAKQGAVIQIVDAAVPPDKRSFPERAAFLATATIAGFLVGLFVALLRSVFLKVGSEPGNGSNLGALRQAL